MTLTAGRDGIVTKRAIQNEPADAWTESPTSDAPPVEITFSVGETRFFGLLIDDPSDTQVGYDTLLIATARDGHEIKAKLKPAPASAAGELFWSTPIAVTVAGNQQAKTYFRLFDLKSDGSDFFLYYTRPARDLPDPANGRRSGHHRADFHRQWREHALSSRRLRENHSERRLGWCRSTLPRDRDDGATSADGNQSLGDRAITLGFIFGLYTISR